MLSLLDKHQSTIALLAATIALFATLISYKQADDARKAAEAETYLSMRERYFTLLSNLPKNADEVEVRRTDEHWPVFKKYWYISLDEWYVTKKIGAFDDLWDDHYGEVVASTLHKKAYASSFCALKDKEFTVGIRQEFAREIQSRFAKHNPDKSLCPPINPGMPQPT